MRKSIVIISSLLALSNMTYAASNTQTTTPATATHPTKQTLNWTYYSKDVFAKAKRANKTVLLFAESETCQWCQKMKDETFSNQIVIDQLQKYFYPVMLSIITERNAAQTLGISSVPVIIYFNADGNVVKKYRGFRDANDMLEQMAVANLLVHRTR